jgi:hypothetical protein
VEKMNKIEKAILQEIIRENREEYQFLANHLPYIYVKDREFTGVGYYTNFQYSKEFKKNNINTFLSSSKILTVENFEHELNYVLDITDGKINYLEIVTNGEDTLEKEITSFKLE